MPMICKLTLDSKEYKAELDRVVIESRAATEKMGVNAQTAADKARKAWDEIASGRKAVEQIKDAVGNLLNPVTIALTVITALVSAAKTIYDHLTVSAEEAAEKAAKYSEAAARVAAEEREAGSAMKGHLTRLGELSSAGHTDNSSMRETLGLLTILERRYGDLGAVIDGTSGAVRNFAEVQRRAGEAERSRQSGAVKAEADALKDRIGADYRVGYKETLMWGTRWARGDGEVDAMRYGREGNEDKAIAAMEGGLKNSTTKQEIDFYSARLADYKKLKELRQKAAHLKKDGYESEEDSDKALLEKTAKVTAAKQGLADTNEQTRRSESDRQYNIATSHGDKIANRQAALREESAKYEYLKGISNSRQKDVDKMDARTRAAGSGTLFAPVAPTAHERADAELAALAAEKEMLESKARMASLENQIADQEKARAKALEKLTEQAKYELEYNNLILNGEQEKAAALKLEKELKEKNLQLTKEEKDEILAAHAALAKQGMQKKNDDDKKDTQKKIAEAKEEVELQRLLIAGRYEEYERLKLKLEMQRAGKNITEEETRELLAQRQALRDLNLKKGLRDQAQGLLGQAMTNAGRGEEWARKQAVRDAEEKKGGKLKDEEKSQVERLADLSYQLANPGRTGLEGVNGSIATNSLTARGGFAGGAKGPDVEKINREISRLNAKQLDIIAEIELILKNIAGGITT